MLSIKNLETWAQKTGGTFSTSSTLVLKSKDIDITVHGKTVEEALQKLNATFETPATTKPEVQKLNINPAPATQNNVQQNSTQQVQVPTQVQQMPVNQPTQQPVMQNPNTTSFNNTGNSSVTSEPFQNTFTNSQNELSKLLAGRRLVKIADGSPLNPNEQIIEYGGMKYVAATIGK